MRHWKNNKIPQAPYYACIFASNKSKNLVGYAEMDKATMEKVMFQEGFLGYEQAGDYDNGIFISYWNSREAIEKWRHDALHQEAKKSSYAIGWYDRLLLQICRVEESREFIRDQDNSGIKSKHDR